MLVPDVKPRQVGQWVLGRKADGLRNAGGFVVAQVLRSLHHVGPIVAGFDLDDLECDQHGFDSGRSGAGDV